MALFSDVDWVIIAIVAAVLFLGPQGRPFVRQMGRWYGRFLQLKNEIMSEVARSAGVGDGMVPTTGSLRAMLIGPDAPPEATASMATRMPAPPGIITQVQPVGMWAVGTESFGAGIGPGTWWITTTSAPGEVVRLR